MKFARFPGKPPSRPRPNPNKSMPPSACSVPPPRGRSRRGTASCCHIRSLGVALAVVAAPCIVFAGTDGTSGPSIGLESQAEMEIAKRQQLAEQFAPQAMERGSAALMERDYEAAFAQYKAAVDALPDAPKVRELRAVAMDGFAKAAMGLAEQRIAEGRWKDAEDTVKKLLEYSPNYKPAQRLLARLEAPDYFNKTVKPGFVSRVEEVKKMLLEGQGLYDSGRFDEAFKKYEEVLALDRYNIAARRGMEQVNLGRSRIADAGYNETRASMITEVDKGWELPVHRKNLGPSAIIEQPTLSARGTESINRKLDDIEIQRLSFADATVREAIEKLQQRSVEADRQRRRDRGDTDDTDLGVNIVIKLDAAAQSQTITLDLANIPLREALDYIVKLANLKFKVDPYAVLVVPQSEPTDTIIKRDFRVPPGFITAVPSGPSDAGGAAGVASTGTAKAFLESRGVPFPPGATAIFLPGSSTLTVRNTPDNINMVETLVQSETSVAPSQIEIESKFVEITQNNLKELGFDWLLGQLSLPGGTGVFGGGGTYGDQPNTSQSYPFNYVNTGTNTFPVGLNPITAGNRSGGTAISANAVDGLLLGNPVTGSATGVLALAGIFTNPQFQVVLRAINQKKGIDVLSAPKVTTKSGSRATMEVVREFRYPREYSPPEIPNSTGSGPQPITPATPTDFDMKKVGVVLEVEPQVGPDNKTIDLRLLPQVTEFEGFINYGSPIENQNVVVTENYINYPVFSVRSVETSVSIYDGQTVALGGLIREDVQKVNDKTPILGDIPLAGVLFRSQADQHLKRNLMIFVTANLIDPAGQPVAAAMPDVQSEEQQFPVASAPVLDAVEPPLPQ